MSTSTRRRQKLASIAGGAAIDNVHSHHHTTTPSLATPPDPSSSSSSSSSSNHNGFVESYDGMIRRHQALWDDKRNQFIIQAETSTWSNYRQRTMAFLRQAFLPEHVTPDYYIYTKWRILQRLVSATVSVFGTRALLLALGVKTEMVGAAATFNWIQKDAFGKFGRIMWASKMGRRFDSDAKRWRFRSSLLFAAGTGLEVITYIFPAAFLLLATLANILKQMSMLTSSATRNAMYKSFAGDAQNLGDITAKGEAQIAVVDLLGILLGISVSKVVGTAHLGMAMAYIGFSVIDVFAIYNEIRSVVFTSLNLERTEMVSTIFVREGADCLPTPNEVAKKERIFLNPKAINYRVFRTASMTGCDMMTLSLVREVFKGEDFLVTYGRGVGLSIILHSRGSEGDILKAVLVWVLVREEMRRRGGGGEEKMMETATLIEVLTRAQKQATASIGVMKDRLQSRGWDVKHMVFGRIKHRTEW